MLRKFENENKKQNKKNLRLKVYGKIRNGRLKLKPSVLIKKTCIRRLISGHTNEKIGALAFCYRTEFQTEVPTAACAKLKKVHHHYTKSQSLYAI